MNTTVTNKPSKGTCVFLFDYTGIMCQPWLDAGYECIIIDGQHNVGMHKDPVNPKLFRVGMWFRHDRLDLDIKKLHWMVGGSVKFLFGFPECTDLAVSGAMHFASKRAKDPEFQTKAISYAKLVESLGNLWACPWALENPVSVMATQWRSPDHYFHPWEYGGYLPEDDVHPTYPEYIKPRDAYPKKTGIWCSSSFIIPPKKPVPVDSGYSQQHLKLGGKSLKTKNIRSATPRGFAQAVFLANHKEN